MHACKTLYYNTKTKLDLTKLFLFEISRLHVQIYCKYLKKTKNNNKKNSFYIHFLCFYRPTYYFPPFGHLLIIICNLANNRKNQHPSVKYCVFIQNLHSKCLHISKKSVPLHRVFHSIRFKVNKGWSKALLLFFAHTSSLQMQ